MRDSLKYMTEQERASNIFVQEIENFRLVFPDLPDSTIAHFAKEAAKNTAGEFMMLRFEIFKFGDLETTEVYWQMVIEHIDEMPSQLIIFHKNNKTV